MKKTLFIFSLFLSIQSTYGQDTLLISRQTVLDKAITNNFEARLADNQAKIAGTDYRQSHSLFLPSVAVSYTAITTNNPLMAFGSKLNQEILTQNDFNPQLLNNPSRVDNFATEISVLQPLLNLDGVYGRSAAKIQKQAYELKAERTKEYLELEVSKLYMQLQLAYEALDVLGKAKHTSQQALNMVKDYYDQGLVKKSDILDVEVRANEVSNQLQYAISSVKNTSDQLAIALGQEPSSTVLKPEERAPSIVEEALFPATLPSNRKDLLAMNKSVEGYEDMAKSSKMQLLPRINAFGKFQVYDDSPFGFGANGYLIGGQLSWNLFDGNKTISKSAKAKLEVQKARLEQEQYESKQLAELNKANRMLSDAHNKVSLTKLSLDQSTESYKIRKDRYEQGLEKTTDLLNSEAQMYKKELEYRQAVFEYNFTKEYLQFLTRQ